MSESESQYAVVKFADRSEGRWTLEEFKAAAGHWVVWNDRYGDEPPGEGTKPYPKRIFVPGRVEIARWVADMLNSTNWFAGMDYAFIVEDGDEDEDQR